MLKHSKKGQEKRDYLISLIDLRINKAEIKKLFIEKYKCNQSIFYDWWHMVTTNSRTGKCLNSRKKKFNGKGDCYFCKKLANHQHHINYEKDLTVPLCDCCHRKIHFLEKMI